MPLGGSIQSANAPRRPSEGLAKAGGQALIRDTRIPVETVLRKLGAGMTAEVIIADHPRLTVADIHAAQAFAADDLADEEFAYD